MVDVCDTVIVNVKPVENPLRLVFLDVGIATMLSEHDRRNFHDVFTAIVLGKVGGTLQVWSPNSGSLALWHLLLRATIVKNATIVKIRPPVCFLCMESSCCNQSESSLGLLMACLLQGETVAELMLTHARYNKCTDVEGFQREMAEIVTKAREQTIKLGKVCTWLCYGHTQHCRRTLQLAVE